METSEDFVTLNQAKKLKELGFEEKCFAYFLYDDEVEIGNYMKDYNYIVGLDYISAPTLYQAQKWLREVKGIHVYSHITSQPELKGKHYWEITSKNGEVLDSVPYIKLVDTYEQALSDGITKALELVMR